MNNSSEKLMKKCKYCQSEIDRKAKICPNCRKKQEKFTYTITSEYDSTFSHYIEGTVINNRDKDYSYVQIEFICYDKDGNNLGTAIDNINNLLGHQTWKFKAMGMFTDDTANHCDFHEISGW